MNALINVCAPPNRVECPTRVCSGSALLMCVGSLIHQLYANFIQQWGCYGGCPARARSRLSRQSIRLLLPLRINLAQINSTHGPRPRPRHSMHSIISSAWRFDFTYSALNIKLDCAFIRGRQTMCSVAEYICCVTCGRNKTVRA